MIIRKEIDFEKPLTEEQTELLKALEARPIEPDSDCPELSTETPERLAALSQEKREERRKQVVTLRLSPQAIKTAKSLGKGYTSVLSRILENVLTDAESIEQYL